MQKKLILSAMALAILVAGVSVAEDTPSAEAIVNKYIKATGGEAAWKAIKSRSATGNILVVAMGMSGTLTSNTALPNSKSVMALDGFGEFLSGIKDGTPWSSNMMAGDQVLEGTEAQSAMRDADPQMWLHWSNYYPTATVEGEEEVAETSTWKVNFAPEEGDGITYWFAKDSGLIIQSYGPGQGGPTTTLYKDYKDAGGIQAPYTLSMEGMNGPIEMTFTDIKINEDIDAAVFDPPAAIAAMMGSGDDDSKEGSDDK